MGVAYPFGYVAYAQVFVLEELKLIVLKEDNNESVLLARKQSNSLLSVAGIGASGLKDVSENPDKYLYGSKKK